MNPMSKEEIKELKERCDKISIAWISTHQVKRLIRAFELLEEDLSAWEEGRVVVEELD